MALIRRSRADPAAANELNDAQGYLVHSSGTYVASHGPEFLTRYFPALFPFGVGGIQDERARKLSFDRYLAHLMRLSTKQFWNYRFVAVAYDLAARARAAKEAYISSTSLALSLCALTTCMGVRTCRLHSARAGCHDHGRLRAYHGRHARRSG
jgi:hypothetical protein